MALTLRTLSDQAENTLEKVIELNEHINAKTKAIEFVLENYLLTCDALEEEKKRSSKMLKELYTAQHKLDTIANGFSVITDLITAKKILKEEY